MFIPVLRLQEFLDKELEARTDLRVLEAGCGSVSYVRFRQETHVVGIDISEQQLQRNPSLHARILGDVQYYDFLPSTFDVIVCWNVLEHLPRPELALERFAAALRQYGIIILGLPNVLSLKGLVTKYLPYWLHVLVYRHLMERRQAGKDDVGPFRTYLRYTIAPNAIRGFAVRNGLKVVYFDTYDALAYPSYLRKNRAAVLVRAVYAALRGFLEFVTSRTLGNSDFIIVLQKIRV